MKEKKTLQWFTTTKWVMEIAGLVMLLLIAGVIVTGVKDSRAAHAMIENIHKSRAGLENAHPIEGVDYDLEARIVGDTDGGWYRGAIAANFGDYVEVRLRIASKNQENISPDNLSFMMTNGFVATELDSQAPTPDQYIGYIPVGIYQFGHKDWYDGKSASTLIAYHDGDTADKLLLVPPYGEVNITLIITLCFIAFAVGVVGPLVVTLVKRHYQEA